MRLLNYAIAGLLLFMAPAIFAQSGKQPDHNALSQRVTEIVVELVHLDEKATDIQSRILAMGESMDETKKLEAIEQRKNQLLKEKASINHVLNGGSSTSEVKFITQSEFSALPQNAQNRILANPELYQVLP